jgi:hypothetical protein
VLDNPTKFLYGFLYKERVYIQSVSGEIVNIL